MKEVEKDYYTTQELVSEEWFPVRSTLTVKKLIETGRLEAVNVSTSPRYKRYRISKKSVEKFMNEQTTKNNVKKKVTKKNNARKRTRN